MFIMHGLPKLTGGPEKWAMLGDTMKSLGIDFAPTVWGFMGAFSECVGGLLLAIGLFTRPACIALLATMIVAASMHISKGDPFVKYSHAVEAGILFISLILIGPGKYSLDAQHKQARQ